MNNSSCTFFSPRLRKASALRTLIKSSAFVGIVAAAACAAPADDSGSAPAAESVVLSDSAKAVRDSLLLIADAARIRGDSAARVWLVVVSDFQCPYCAQFHREVLPRINREYIATGKIRLAYMNFPLVMHRHAWPTSEYAMCAGLQGKFWEYHDALFESQQQWSQLRSATTFLDSLSGALGLDSAITQSCVESQVMRLRIRADVSESENRGIRSTPTFLVAGKMLEGLQTFANLKLELDSALAAAGGGE